jgi:hypothetical protein
MGQPVARAPPFMARRWSRLLQARVGIASVSAAERLLLLCLGNPVIPRATIARGRGGSHPSMAIPMDRNASHDATRMHELISARRDEHSLEWRACSGSGKKSAVCRHNAAALTVGSPNISNIHVVTSKATTPVALTCRWRSRPQHQERPLGVIMRPRKLHTTRQRSLVRRAA